MNMFRYPEWHHLEGRLNRQYLRVCATFKLLRLCRIDSQRAVELLNERRIPGADRLVSLWCEQLEKNEWATPQKTVLGAPYTGPRP